jgi:Trypsin
MDNITHVTLRAGLHRLFTQTAQFTATIQARDFRPHPQYNDKTLVNDIGLIFVMQRIPFSNSVQQIALPARSQINNRLVGQTGTIIGWGRFSDGELLSHW